MNQTLLPTPGIGRARRYLDSLERELADLPEAQRDDELRRARTGLHAFTAAGLAAGMDEVEATDFALRRLSNPIATLGETVRLWLARPSDTVTAAIVGWLCISNVVGIGVSLLTRPLIGPAVQFAMTHRAPWDHADMLPLYMHNGLIALLQGMAALYIMARWMPRSAPRAIGLVVLLTLLPQLLYTLVQPLSPNVHIDVYFAISSALGLLLGGSFGYWRGWRRRSKEVAGSRQ